MAVEDDQSTWLPAPPPPRPARRDAAIEAAMRKFDGVEEPVRAAERPARSWVSTHRPQLGLAMSAALIVIIGVPAAIIGFREPPRNPERTSQVPVSRYNQPVAPVTQVTPKAEPGTPAAVPPPVAPPPAPKAKDVGVLASPSVSPPKPQASAPSLKVANEPAMQAAPAPVVAAPPAPPPPPPLPPPAAPAPLASADNAGRGEIVVTGSIMRRDAQKPSGFDAMAKKDAYAPFLSQLQRAVRANDRDAVVGLIDFPLRVNVQGASRMYRDAQSVERDYDRIFTPKVRRAILRQRAGQLFVRDQGAMIGDGEVWFDHSCPNSQCSPLGPVRIKAVNP